ncbi:hypothetical protein GCM10018773_02680 [Streptomyces candidus]|nr:hypothetical protein GCM10018773_02680 [Streptomyces candidus]
MVTLVGNAASGPVEVETPRGGSVKFRLAVQPRYFHREKETWADGPTSFYTVWTRRTLAANLTSSLSIGEPVIVHGRLRIKEETKDDRRRLSAEVEAVAVGHDLNRGTAAFRKVTKADPRLVEPAAVRAAEAALWAVESPVNRAARGAPTGAPGDPSEEPFTGPSGGATDDGVNQKKKAVSAVS